MLQKRRNSETFNDGIVTISKADKRTIVSDIGTFRFGLRTIGVNRFYNAKIAAVNIDKLISVPLNNIITSAHIAIINNVQYEIKQVQSKYDSEPASMYLTLNKIIPQYSDERRSGNEDS